MGVFRTAAGNAAPPAAAMLETAAALVLAHLLGDFVLQTDAMVRDKARPPVLLGTSASSSPRAGRRSASRRCRCSSSLIGASHLAIDLAKLRSMARRAASPPSPPTRPRISR